MTYMYVVLSGTSNLSWINQTGTRKLVLELCCRLSVCCATCLARPACLPDELYVLLASNFFSFLLQTNCYLRIFWAIFGPIPWGHSGPLCHALSLSSLASWTSMHRRRATVPVATPGEWA